MTRQGVSVAIPIDDELIAQLALNRVPGIGSLAFSSLLGAFGSARAVFNASRQQLSTVSDSNSDIAEIICRGVDATGVEQDLLWLEQERCHHIITLEQAEYPALLLQIHRPPPVLFLKGDASLLQTVQLAVVGSRHPTPGGSRNAREFARKLAAIGLTITSGLATGIDGAAHQGALDAGVRDEKGGQQGRTIAVAATGLDRIYPSRHRDLAHEIAEHGLLISEFPVGTEPLRSNFPRRNRLISGLSLGTLVVEAAVKSGSLITARYAMEQGREVFAIPGSIHSPLSRGCHWLIQQGAKLVETADDIAEELLPLLPAVVDENDQKRTIGPGFDEGLTKEQQVLLNAIGFDPVNLDILLVRTGLEINDLSVFLSQLELQKLIDALPGGRYIRRSKP
jgi:DNA processing protein